MNNYMSLNQKDANIIQKANYGFKDMENLEDLIKKLTTKLCRPEDMLISRNELSDIIYFISKGTVEIYIDDPRNSKQN